MAIPINKGHFETMKIRKGHIYLTHDELSKTRNLTATELNCGHNVVPKLRGMRYFQHVHCPVCRKQTFVMSDCVYTDAEDMLKS